VHRQSRPDQIVESLRRRLAALLRLADQLVQVLADEPRFRNMRVAGAGSSALDSLAPRLGHLRLRLAERRFRLRPIRRLGAGALDVRQLGTRLPSLHGCRVRSRSRSWTRASAAA
jgi:hypothetical protein